MFLDQNFRIYISLFLYKFIRTRFLIHKVINIEPIEEINSILKICNDKKFIYLFAMAPFKVITIFSVLRKIIKV